MANRCGCTTACNCKFTEDGWFSGRDQDGRRNTVVEGNGFSAGSAFQLSFQQSEFYRPPAFEVRVASKFLSDGVENFVIWDEEIFAGVPLVVEYESPNDSAYQPFIGSTFDGTALTEGNFHFIGASVTFPAAASGTYQLIINGLDPITKNQTIYAAVRQNASASFSQTLTCGGFSPGVLDFTNISPDVESFLQLDAWMLELWQTTGNLIQVTDIRFWMITI